MRVLFCLVYLDCLNQYDVFLGDLHLSGSIIRKSRFILTKEQRTIAQKERMFKSLK